MTVVEDHRGDALDTPFEPQLLGLAYRVGEPLVLQDGQGLGAVQSDLGGDIGEHRLVGQVAPVGEMGGEQCHLQVVLASVPVGPMQQLVGVEGVVHAHVVGVAELEAHVGAGLRHADAAGVRLLLRGAVFLGHMLAHVLAFGRHAGVQLERVPANLMRGACRLQRRGKLPVADDAPGAHHVRHDVDLERGCGFVHGRVFQGDAQAAVVASQPVVEIVGVVLRSEHMKRWQRCPQGFVGARRPAPPWLATCARIIWLPASPSTRTTW